MDQPWQQLDSEEEDRYLQVQTETEETIAEDEEEDYEDLYNDVDVGFVSPPDLDLDLPAPENLTAAAESPVPEPPKDNREAKDGPQGVEALTQRAERESNAGPARIPASAATSTPNRRGNSDYAEQDSAENSGSDAVLFVGNLQWWTTDADLEAALSEYGRVKSIEFSQEKASGKSRGCCDVQFYNYACARACKEGMNGRVLDGRACVITFKNSSKPRQVRDGMVHRGRGGNHQDSQSRRMMDGSGGGQLGSGGGRVGSGGEGGRGRYHGRSSRGPGGHGGQGRGQGGQGRGQGGQDRGRAGKGMGGGSGSVSGGGQYGQVYLGPIGGGTMRPPIRNHGFDLTFGGQMGRGGGAGGYMGFAAQASHAPPHFSALVHSFSPVASVGMGGVAPHVNPAFFGQGMSGNGVGMVPSGSGMEGYHGGMWTDSGWGGDGHGRRMSESGYGEGAGLEHAYDEKNHERGGRSSVQRKRDRSTEDERMGPPERRYRNNREADWNVGRDSYRENERDGYQDHRERGRNRESERTPRSRGRSHAMEEADLDDFAKESDYAKWRN